MGKTTVRSKIPVSYMGFLNWNLVMFAHDGSLKTMAKFIKYNSRVVEKYATTGHVEYRICSK